MNLKLPQAFGGAIALASFLSVAVLTSAQAAETVRVRGTIVGLEGSTLTVKTREGPNAMVMLKPGAKVAGVTKASVEISSRETLSASPRSRQPLEETGRLRSWSLPPRRRGPARAVILGT